MKKPKHRVPAMPENAAGPGPVFRTQGVAKTRAQRLAERAVRGISAEALAKVLIEKGLLTARDFTSR